MNRTDTPFPSVIKHKRAEKSGKAAQLAIHFFEALGKRVKINLSPIAKMIGSGLDDKNKQYIKYFVFAFISFLISLAELPGKLYPFGTALVTSVCSKDAYFAFAGAGIACISYGTNAAVQFITYIMLFLIRRSVTGGRFDEKPGTRLAENACASLFCGVVRASSGFGFDAILSAIILTGTSLCACYLFSVFFSRDKYKMSSGIYTLSLLAICACAVNALGRLEFAGISFSLIAACIITLFFAKANGLIYAGVSGLVCGFACANASLSVALGISGLICGALFKSAFLPVLIFMLCAGGLSVYLTDLSAMSQFLPEIIAGCILFMPLSYYRVPEFFKISGNTEIKSKTPLPMSKSEFDTVSDCLSKLSGIFGKLSEHFKYPSATETKDIIEDAFAESCSVCSMNNMCYAKKQCDRQELNKKISSTLKNSPLECETLSEMLDNKCIHYKDINAYINREYSALTFNYLHSNRTRSLAGQYNAMSHLIKTTQERAKDNSARDTRLERLISSSLKKIGVVFGEVYVFGKRTKDIEVHSVKADKIPCSSKDLSEYLSKETGVILSEPSFDISDRADMIMRLSKTSAIEIEYAKSTCSKDGEDVNGDTVTFFDTEEDYFYSLISDGMGNGRDAAVTSRLSCIFLEKMLCSGTKKNVCLELLNNLLLSKNDETFSTVDLLEIDKLNSCACFIKAGAAPSFILRGTKLYKISSSTPPAGIIQSFSAESTSFPLQNGDVIIMVSDGIIQTGDDALWLSEIIHIDTKDEPALLCAQIAEKAKVKNMRSDDMSVCVLRIKHKQ